MALREGECFLVQRVADRGIDENIGGSRACVEDRLPTCRFTARGSDGVCPYPWDYEIKRLKRRVCDLEIKQGIKRLRQRVRDLELQREMQVKETESGTVFRDDLNEEEEHPFHHPDPRFDEPIYEHESGQDFLPDEEPQYDEDGFSPDEEECLLVRMALISNTVQEPEQNEDGEDCIYSKRNLSVDDDEVAFKSLLAKDGGVSMVGIGVPMAIIGGPSFSQKDPMGLLIDPRLSGFQINGDWHNQPVNGEFEKGIHIQKKVMDTLLASEGDSQRTQYPYVTGTSIIGIKYKDGILMAADMGGSYGSTIRYKNVERIKQVGKHSLIGASGEISDFQEILKYLDELILHDNMWDDGNSLGPKEVYNYLTRVMYNRRNKFDPLWNSLVIGGVKNGHKYLGSVSMIGVNYEDNHIATGFGNHLARPILREEWREDLSFEEGVKLLEKCIRNLLYRDRSAVNKLQIAKITEEGLTVSQPYSLKTFWNFAAFQNPTVGAEGSW